MESIIIFLKTYSYLVVLTIIMILWVVLFWYMLSLEKKVKRME
jgi:hypothetical protein